MKGYVVVRSMGCRGSRSRPVVAPRHIGLRLRERMMLDAVLIGNAPAFRSEWLLVENLIR
jgi:hypothetical protein